MNRGCHDGTRKDGSRVEGHERRSAAVPKKPAAKIQRPHIVGPASRLFPAGDPKSATHVHFAGRQYTATDERGFVKQSHATVRKYTHPDAGHLWLDDDGQVHGGSAGHAEKLRARHRAHAARIQQAAKPEKQETQPMTKALPVAFLSSGALPMAKSLAKALPLFKAKAPRVNLSGLLAEMAQAQRTAGGMMSKSFAPELWVHGRESFA